LANDFCPNQVVEQLRVVIADERGRAWAQAHPEYFGGVPLAPLETCTEGATYAQVRITQPAPGSTVHGVVPVIGTVQMPNFERYEVQYGVGGNPQDWRWISGPHRAQVQGGLLTEWDATYLSPGPYTVRVTAFDREGHRVEGQVQVQVVAPTGTPTSAQTPTPTTTVPPPSPTVAPTEPAPPVTDTPVPEPSPVPTQTPISVPIEIPEATPTPEPSATPEADSNS